MGNHKISKNSNMNSLNSMDTHTHTPNKHAETITSNKHVEQRRQQANKQTNKHDVKKHAAKELHTFWVNRLNLEHLACTIKNNAENKKAPESKPQKPTVEFGWLNPACHLRPRFVRWPCTNVQCTWHGRDDATN